MNFYDPLAIHFERHLPGSVEIEQMAPTRRQLSDGVAVFLSRIDRIYARVCPIELSGMVVKAMAVGDAIRPNNPFDHIPISARISRKRARQSAIRASLSAALWRADDFT